MVSTHFLLVGPLSIAKPLAFYPLSYLKEFRNSVGTIGKSAARIAEINLETHFFLMSLTSENAMLLKLSILSRCRQILSLVP